MSRLALVAVARRGVAARFLIAAALVLSATAPSKAPPDAPPEAAPDAAPGGAQNATYTDAVRAQLEGRQAEAQQSYERLIGGGLRNADVEYNLGTSYGESGDLGLAVLHLCRAQALRRAPDIGRNLAAVRERVLESRPPGTNHETPLVADIADALVHLPIEAMTAIFSAIFALLTLAAYGPRRLPPGWLKGAALASLGLAVFSAGLVFFRNGYLARRPAAVVIKNTGAKEGPDQRFKTIADVAPGEEVRLVAGSGSAEYALVELPGGQSGYVPKEAVAKVVDWRD